MNKKISKPTILVMEDERPLLEAINTMLAENGFQVIAARSVEEAFNAKLDKSSSKTITIRSIEQALKYLESLEQIDAIWLDHNLLGEENGFDFVKKFKANGGRWKKVPVFVVSNTAAAKTMRAYTEAGASKYYVKSNHRLDEIIRDIKSFLDPPKK